MPNVISNTSKMPEGSTSIPIKYCRTGQALMKNPNSICAECYGDESHGRYGMNTVKNALNWRYALWIDTPHEWEAQLITGINRKRKAMKFFRWFDVGDIQGEEMADAIMRVCRSTPSTQHWLPTKEYKLARYMISAGLPSNLVLRVSAHLVGQAPPKEFIGSTSTVHEAESLLSFGKVCHAGDTSPPSCGPCRACWDPTIENVSYPFHTPHNRGKKCHG